jgi:sugar lactone lactonase YvrE
MAQAVQLLARGIQDEWLSGKPQVSFYRSHFKRNVPFGSSVEQFVVPVDGKIIINAKGDLIGYTYLTAHDTNTGALVPNVNWSTVISSVDLVIGNQVIATHDMTYINTIQKALESDTYSKRSQTNTFQSLGFFFDKQPLPIAALKYTDVKINITWVSDSVSKQYVYKCWSHCIRLSGDERMFFATQTHRFLIPQMQRVRISNEPNFHGPVKYIAAPCINYSNVYKPIQILPGIVQWGARIAGTGVEQGNGISVDGSGNLYVTGYYVSNPLRLYNSDGSAFATTLPNLSGFSDSFIAKYNTSGTVQWGARIAGSVDDQGLAISVDGSGNLYVTGYYNSTLTLYNSDGSAFATTLANSGSNDCFIAKYNTSGTVQWGARIAGTGFDRGNGISVDGSGNLYVTGYYASNPLTLYNSDGSAFATTLPNSGSNDCFIAKYNTSGTVQWGSRIAGTGDDQGIAISVDGSGNLYVTGLYASNPLTLYNSDGSAFSTTLASSGSNDCFIAKYNTSGTVQWGARIAGTGADQGNGISVDGSGNIYVTGSYASNPLTLYNSDGSAFSTTLASSGSFDCFIAKYNTSGTVQWGARIAGTGSDRGFAISVDGSGNMYVTGFYTSNPLTLYNSDGSAFATTLAFSGNNDCFIAKYNTSGTVQWGARIAGTGAEQGYGISVDGSGNMYVTGSYTSNPLRLYNSDGSAFATTLAFSGIGDCFIAKYTA